MLIDQIHFLFNLIIGLFLLRWVQARLTAGPVDNALGYLLH